MIGRGGFLRSSRSALLSFRSPLFCKRNGFLYLWSIILNGPNCFCSLLPESPRYLIAHDRDEEAAAILVKYHAEGDRDSLLVKAEIAQIRETIKTEMEVSKQSWLELVKTAGMRRRVIVSAFIGLFTQLSGNTLLSYYSNILFEMMGYTSEYAKTRINLANACWSLANATAIALVVTRFPRRIMYMLSATCMCLVFIAMTVSLERLEVARDAGVSNKAAGISALFWYFAYAPTYNIGNNALTYSKSCQPGALIESF